MRKIFTLLMALLMLISLIGCKSRRESRPEEKLLVTALGFDYDGENYTVTAETVKAQNSGENSISFLSDESKNLESAFLMLSAKSSLPLSLSHTAAVVFGESITVTAAEQIRLFLTSVEQFPLSAVTLSAEDAKELITSDTGDEPKGILLQSLLAQKYTATGIGGNTAFFEIATALIQPIKLFALPRVLNSGGFLEIDELCLAREDFCRRLSYEESLVYALVRNLFEGGRVFINGRVTELDKVSVSLVPRLQNGRLKLDFTLKTKENGDAVAKVLRECIQKSQKDIFGIDGEIYRADKELFDFIYDDYEKYYREKSVEVKVVKG